MNDKPDNETGEMPEVVGPDVGPAKDLPPVKDSDKKRLEVILYPEPGPRHQNPYAVEDAQREVRGRLNAIEGLRQEGVISEQEYRQARDITVYGPAGAAAQQAGGKGGPPGGGKLVIGPGDIKDPDRRPAWLIPTLVGVGIVAVIALIVGLTFVLASPSGEEVYAENVAAPLNSLGDSAGTIAATLASVSEPGDVPGLRSSIRTQIRTATGSRNKIDRAQVPGGLQTAHAKVQAGANNYVLYLQALLRAASPTPSAAPVGISKAKAQVTRLKGNFTAAQKLNSSLNVSPIVDAGLGSTSGLAGAQRKKAAAIEAERRRREEAARLADITTPAPSGAGAGIDYDIVDNSGGEGVRYRYTPFLAHTVPGNGPFEGDQVSLNCYTDGEPVRGNDWWALLTNDYYVPATYLRYGAAGPPPGARIC